MLLKRRTYVLGLGLVAAQLCLARAVGDLTQFGNCAACQAAHQTPLPLDTSQISQINTKLASPAATSFVAGNGVLGTTPNLSTLPTSLAASNASQSATQNLVSMQLANQAASTAAAQAAVTATAQGASPAAAQAIAQNAAQIASQSVLNAYSYASQPAYAVPQYAAPTQAQYNAIVNSYVPVASPLMPTGYTGPAYQWGAAPTIVSGFPGAYF